MNDTQPPFITRPADIDDVVSGPTVETFATPAPSDNCPGVTVGCVPASGSTFPIGTTLDTCTATDTAANTATCSFDITLTVPTPSPTPTPSATPSPTPTATPFITPTPLPPTGEVLTGNGCALQRHSEATAAWSFLRKALQR